MKKKIAIILVGIMTFAMASGCSFIKEKKTEGTTTTVAKTEEPTEVVTASGTDPMPEASTEDETEEITTEQKISGKKASCGSDDGYVYTNDFANFDIDITDSDWYFYSSDKIAEAVSKSSEEVEAYLSGDKSPYDIDITYCSLVYKASTSSNIIVYYVNPSYYNMSEGMTGKEYLELGASGYEGVEVTEAKLAGRNCGVMQIPRTENSTYSQYMYAFNNEGLIVVISFSIMDDDKLDEAIALVQKL